MKKIIVGIFAILLFVCGLFIGYHYNANSVNNETRTEEITTQTSNKSNDNESSIEPKTLKEEEERNQNLVEKYIKTILSTENDTLSELNNMQKQLSEEVYKSSLIEKRGQLKVNKVLNSTVLRVSLYQNTSDKTQYIVIAEVDSRDQNNKSRIVYPYYLVSVKNGIIEEVKLSLEND